MPVIEPIASTEPSDENAEAVKCCSRWPATATQRQVESLGRLVLDTAVAALDAAAESVCRDQSLNSPTLLVVAARLVVGWKDREEIVPKGTLDDLGRGK